MNAESLNALIEAYNNLYLKNSLAVRLSRVCQITENDDIAHLRDVIVANDLRAFCYPLPLIELNHIDLEPYESLQWQPLSGILPSSNVFYSKSKNSKEFSFHLKLILHKPHPLPAANILDALIKTFQQIIPHFGFVTSIGNLHLPFAAMGDVYCDILFDSTQRCIQKIDILAHSMKIGCIEYVDFEENFNGDDLLQSIKKLMKNDNGLNLDLSLQRNGLYSLQIASLEYELRQKFGENVVPFGKCLTAPTLRELIGFVNGLCVRNKQSITPTISDLTDETPWPLSEAQKQLLGLFEMDSDAAEYFFEEFTITIEDFSNDELKSALMTLVSQNPILRLKFNRNTATLLRPTECFNQIFNEKNDFDTASVNPLKNVGFVFFIDSSSMKNLSLSIRIHHILLDGRSTAMLVTQLLHILKEKEIKPKKITLYKDFVKFENEYLDATNFDASITYWSNKMSKIEPSRRSLASETNGKVFSLEIPSPVMSALRGMTSTSTFAAFYGIYRCFMHKLHGHGDYPVLIPIDNRLSTEFENTLGLFVNLVISNFEFNPQATILKIFEAAEFELNECQIHSRIPFHKVLSLVRKEHKSDNIYVPEVMLVHDCVNLPKGCTLSIPARKKYIQANEIWYFREFLNSDRAEIVIEARDGSLADEIRQRQLIRFVEFLGKIVKEKGECHFFSIDLLTEKESEQFFEYRKSLTVQVPSICVLDQIMHHINNGNPKKQVLLGSFEGVSNYQLCQLINNFEIHILRLFPQNELKNNVIGLAMNRSPTLIAIILACWKLQIAPLMIADEWPPQRIKMIVGTGHQFGLLAVITDRYESLHKQLDCDVYDVDQLSVSTRSTKNIAPVFIDTQIAYLTFTSGSTGTPKAVASTEIGLRNIAFNYARNFGFDISSIVYSVVNPAFDIFFADLVSALCHGGTLYLASSKIPKLKELKYCTHAYIMPAYLNQINVDDSSWIEVLSKLEAVLYGGEVIGKTFLQKALAANVKLFQQFGVTEHAIYSNVLQPNSENDYNVLGTNFVNYHGYLVDCEGCRLPPEKIGATCGTYRSTGTGVSVGYIDDKCGNEKFGVEKWSCYNGWKYFDTGDRMEFVEAEETSNPWSKKLIFLGRTDSIVKVRGNRIDLNEIKQTLLSLNGVINSVVVFDSEISAIVAGLILNDATSVEKVQTDVEQMLPSFMVPTKFVQLEKFPLNSNGKVDNNEVLKIINATKFCENEIAQNTSANLTEIISIALSIFSKHLKQPNLTINDNLLLHGADSLKLLMALNELEDVAHVKISLKTIFAQKTLQKCVKNCSVIKHQTEFTPLESSKLIASLSQEHLWFLTHFVGHGNSVNDSYQLRFVMKLDEGNNFDFKGIIKMLLQKHVVLRTLLIDSPEGDLECQVMSVDDAYDRIMTQSKFIFENLAGFDHSTDPPIAFIVSDATLEVVCHHIAVDGWSLRLIVEDIVSMVDKNIPISTEIAPDCSYFEFAKMQKEQNFENELKFFQETLKDVIKFAIPTDFDRPSVSNNNAKRLEATFAIKNPEIYIEKSETTLFALFLAIYADSFFELNSDFNVLTIGVPFANRKPQFFNTVGYFVNSLPIVIIRQTSFSEQIAHIHQQLLQTTENSVVPFELVVRNLKMPRNPYKHAIFQVMVIFEDLRDEQVMNGPLKFVEIPSNTAKFEQTWRVKRYDATTFKLEIEYAEGLFQETTIESAKSAFLNKINFFFVENVETCQAADVVKETWARFLDVNVSEIDKTTNFFEIGGHSLTAVRLCQALSKAIGQSVSVKTLFEHQKFADFCNALNIENQQYEDNPHRYPVNQLQVPLLRKLKHYPNLTSAYTHNIELQCPENFNDADIEDALTLLCHRHECLNLKFVEIDGIWYMEKNKKQKLKLISKSSSNGITFGADAMIQAYRHPVQPHIITLEISHLVADGHSMNVLADDLQKASFKQLSTSKSPSYYKFSKQFNALYQNNFEKNATFWKTFLRHSNGHLETDFPANQSTINIKSGKSIEITFKNAATTLVTASARSKVSPFAVLMHRLAFRLRERLIDFESIFRVAFCKDLRPVDTNDDYFKSIGFYVGTFVIPMAQNDKVTDTAAKLAQIDKHAAFTIDDIATIMTENGEKGSLFDVMLVYDNAPVVERDVNDNCTVVVSSEAKPKTPLTFFVQNRGKHISLKIEFDDSIWTETSITSIATAWMNDICHNTEIRKLRSYHQGIHKSIEQHNYQVFSRWLHKICSKNLLKPAFLSENIEITYEMLLKSVNSIASFIRKTYLIGTDTNFHPDVIIPVVATKSIDTWLTCLGIMYAGGAYLPIDPNLVPIDRINAIFTLIQPLLIVSENTLDASWNSILLSDIISKSKNCEESFTHVNEINDLAYVIMTSGTTGLPKAVAATHLGVMNMVADAVDFLKIDDTSMIYQFTNFCFDNSVLEVFAGLAAGATIFVPSQPFNSIDFVNDVSKFGVTHAMLFPGLVSTFTDAELAILGSIECWITGAEKLSQQLFERFLEMRTKAKIVQNYGPTETTAYILRKQLKIGDNPQNLGSAMLGAKIKVARPDGYEVAVGGKGELFVSSIGLMRGYIGMDVQPFVEFSDEPGICYYPTGDICILLPLDEIKFVGRRDNQVKIRGFRVELDEIETILMKQPEITMAKAVIDPQTNQDIIAFFSEMPFQTVNIENLRNVLKSKLPYYAVPRKLSKVETFPLTANSKVDVDALLGIMQFQSLKPISNLAAPSIIYQIWSEVLQMPIDKISDNDDFFYFGGNSLTAIKMLSQITEKTNIQIDATEFFKKPTITTLQKLFENNLTKIENNQCLSMPLSHYPLSFQQEQMLYLSSIDPLGVYNLVFVQEFKASLDLQRLQTAILKLVQNNPILRTKMCEIHSSEGVKFVQEVLPWNTVKDKVNIDVKNITKWNNIKDDLHKFKLEKFDLFADPPLRCQFLRDNATGNIVVILVVHHIASDGFSTGLIENQLKSFYENEQTNIGKSNIMDHSYGEYAQIQRNPESIQQFHELLNAYEAQFTPQLHHSTSFVSIFEMLKILKPKELAQTCKTYHLELKTPRNKPATAFTLIINAVKKVVFAETSCANKTLMIAAPCANRYDPRFSKTIGNFLTTLLYPATNTDIDLKRLEAELLSLSKYGSIPLNLLSKHMRNCFEKTAIDAQVFVNCRYNIEDESAIVSWSDAVETSEESKVTNIFPTFVNYPVEIDLDEYPKNKTKVTIRMSNSFYESTDTEKGAKRFVDKLMEELKAAFVDHFDTNDNSNPVNLIAQSIGIPVSELDMVKSFFDNGGDSFALWRLHRSILASNFNKIDLRDLIKVETVKKLVSLMEAPQRPETLLISQNSTNSTVSELFTRIHLSTNTPLGEIIIFVYPLIGGSLSYGTLIKKLKGLDSYRKIQTIIGLNPPKNFKVTSIESLAALHLSEINRRYALSKFSKVVIIGASFGATLGFEMAKRITEQLAGNKLNSKLAILPSFNKLRVSTFRLTSRKTQLDPRRHSVTLAQLPSARPSKLDSCKKTNSKVKLISIDGTIKTLKADLPTFDEHKHQIIKIAKKHGIKDESTVNEEIDTSWKLLNLATSYLPLLMSNVDILLLRVRSSIQLEHIWKQVCGNGVDVGIIPATHETMLNEPHVDIVAQKAFVWM